MPENDYDDEPEDQPQTDNADIRRLREKAKKADELEAKLSVMERNEAFRSAGLDPDDPKARYFVKGYDGELDTEKIRTAATEAGFLSPPDQTQTPAAPQGERVAAASSGAALPSPADARDELAELERAALASGGVAAAQEAIQSWAERHGVPTTRQTQ